MSEITPEKAIPSRRLSWRREWWHWLRSREYQAGAKLWEYLTLISLLLFILIAFVYLLGFLPPYRALLSIPGLREELVGALTVTALVCVVAPFGVFLALVPILSFHPVSRKWADRTFHFRDSTELEELNVRVGTIEKDILSQNEEVHKELDDVRGRLESIEAALERLLANDDDKRDKGRATAFKETISRPEEDVTMSRSKDGK